MHNNSEKRIFIQRGTNYPDTTFKGNQFFKSQSINNSEPGTSNDKALISSPSGLCWETRFQGKEYFMQDTLIVWIFDANKIGDMSDPNNVLNDQLLLQRYDLSLSDLRMLDFQLHFPPTDAMRHVKMYPPFKP